MDSPLPIFGVLRTLAPAGGFASPLAILNARRELRQILSDDPVSPAEALARFLGRELGARAFAFGSGKQALEALFCAVRAKNRDSIIGMAGYTCPDIAAAVLRAGLRVLPLEVNERTLEIEKSAAQVQQEPTLGGVVLSNLYGLLDRLDPWQELQAEAPFIVVDDACQAALSTEAGIRAGCRPGSVGVYSFGRGKGFCGVGGGALVFANESGVFPEKTELCSEEICGLVKSSEATFRETVVDALYGFCLWALEAPLFYTIPANLPFLGLGQTKPDLSYKNKGFSRPMLYHAAAQWRALEERSLRHIENAKSLSQLLPNDVIQPFIERGFAFDGTVCPIRYPIVFPTALLRNQAFDKLSQAGLGASKSYPGVLGDYPELAGSLLKNETPKAKDVSERILTLPVHPLVTQCDIARAASIVCCLMN